MLLSILWDAEKLPDHLSLRCSIPFDRLPIGSENALVAFLCTVPSRPRLPVTANSNNSLVMCSNSPRVVGNAGGVFPLFVAGASIGAFILVARELCKRAGKRFWLWSSVVRKRMYTSAVLRSSLSALRSYLHFLQSPLRLLLQFPPP